MDLDDIKRCFKHLIDDGPFETILPDQIDADYLISNILGFKESDDGVEFDDRFVLADVMYLIFTILHFHHHLLHYFYNLIETLFKFPFQLLQQSV